MIQLTIPWPAPVTVTILDLQGHRVAKLADGDFAPGVGALAWGARDLAGRSVAPGVYFVRMRAEASGALFSQTRTILYVK